jgi:hypothetical protein
MHFRPTFDLRGSLGSLMMSLHLLSYVAEAEGHWMIIAVAILPRHSSTLHAHDLDLTLFAPGSERLITSCLWQETHMPKRKRQSEGHSGLAAEEEGGIAAPLASKAKGAAFEEHQVGQRKE